MNSFTFARTVTTHVCNILCNLGVETRFTAAMQVARVTIGRRPPGEG